MCFAPQLRALFRHLNFQKLSEDGGFCTFWLGNVLRATTACNFFRYCNSLKCSKPGVLCTFWLGNVLWARTACNFSSFIWPHGSAPAALASLLFDLPVPHHWKNTVFCDFPTFSRTGIFFLLKLSLFWSSFFFSSLLWLFPPVLFHLSMLSEVWLLNFLRWETVWDNPTLRQWNWNSQAFGVQLFSIFSLWSFAVILNLIVRDDFFSIEQASPCAAAEPLHSDPDSELRLDRPPSLQFLKSYAGKTAPRNGELLWTTTKVVVAIPTPACTLTRSARATCTTPIRENMAMEGVQRRTTAWNSWIFGLRVNW